MSWAGGTYDFALNTSKSEMVMRIEDSLNRERGYLNPVHQQLLLLEDIEPSDGYDEAEEKLSELYSKYGRKYNYGIKYLDYSKVKPTKKMQDLDRRIKELEQKISDYATEHSVLKFKAEFVGCPCCGSKLKREMLKSDNCPLCHTDMRSNTTLTTLKGYKDKIRDLKKQHTAETKKMKGKTEMRWLVNAEAYIG